METPHTAPTTAETLTSTERTPEALATLQGTLDLDSFRALRVRQQETYYDAYSAAQMDGKSGSEVTSAAFEATQLFTNERMTDISSDAKLNPEDSIRLRDIANRYGYPSISEEDWDSASVNEHTEDVVESGAKRFIIETDSFLNPEAAEAEEAATSEESSEEEAEEAQAEASAVPAIEVKEAFEDSAELALLRQRLSKMSSKRQGNFFGRGKKYEALQAEYDAQVVINAKRDLKEALENPDIPEHTKREAATAYLFDEQTRLREATVDKIKNSKVRKFIDRMNKGSVAWRVAKGIGLGVAVAGVAGFAGAAVGAAGFAAASAGVATTLIAGGRFARSYAQAEAKKGTGMRAQILESDMEAAHKAATESDGVDYFAEVQKSFQEVNEKEVKAEQAKRRKSAVAGMTGVALGSALGFTLAVANEVNWGEAARVVGEKAGAGLAVVGEAAGKGIGAAGELAGRGADAVGLDKIDLWPFDNEVVAAGDGTGSEHEAGQAYGEPTVNPELQPAAFNATFEVADGQGGIDFFETNLGLTEAQWYEAQPELAAKFPDEFLSNGYLNNSGQLSTEAQDYLKNRFGL